MTQQGVKYQLIDHGIEHEQYFQGCGVAFTEFDHVSTGCGENFAEALSNALEMISQDQPSEFVKALEEEMFTDMVNFEDESLCVSEMFHTDEDRECNEMYYYVSVRYNVG